MKTCFKCKMALPISEFYAHPRMGDGHLGKCKTCTRKDTSDRVAKKLATDLNWVLAERERHRLKSTKRRADGLASPQTPGSNESYALRYPEKAKARQMVSNAIRAGLMSRQPCEICCKKAQAHHDDYTKPLDVRWLCPFHHGEHHAKQRDAEIIASFAP